MSLETPPARFAAGDTVRFPFAPMDYPATAGWALAFRLVGTGIALTLPGTANGSGFTVEATAAATGGLTVAAPGVPCTLYGYATKTTERFKVYEAPCFVLPNPATATGDLRGQAAIALAAIDALLSGRASKDQQSYKINGRELVRMTVPDLLKLRDHFNREVARETAAAGLAVGRPTPRRIDVRFGSRA